MRDILFKAKNLETGEWAEGSYAYAFNEDENCHVVGIMKECHYIVEKGGNLLLIDKDTICQYTGLTDKNGNKIWENDVVYIPYMSLEDSYCKVVFRRGGFIGEMADGCEDCLLNRKIEVIGNIFDNPEFLKEE